MNSDFMPSKAEMFEAQMCNFKTYLNRTTVVYGYLLQKRLDDTLTRTEYMFYDLMDMMIPLIAALDEVSSKEPFPSYLLEKMEKVKSYVDTTYEYVKAMTKEKSESVNKDDNQ